MILIQLINDFDYKDIDLELLTLLLDYITIRALIPNGGLLIQTVLDTSSTSLIEYNDYLTIVENYKLHIANSIVSGLYGITDPSMPGNPLTGPQTLEEFLRSTTLYQQLKIFFTYTNDVTNITLTNQAKSASDGGIDLQSLIPVITGTTNPYDMDLFDTGINSLADPSIDWRQRISTLSYAGDNTVIKRADAELLELRKSRKIENIIDIIDAYLDGMIISKGINPNTTFLEGTSDLVEEHDMFVIKSGRFNGTTRPYTYIVIKITQVNITQADNLDTYKFNIWRF